ncbi:hypothetical protein VTJ04DRAFT_6238 [Mycothermus thermophilus]|uniref:uncharacterized protein n=1 Tax=Humicola insolens TaxID=85995 RepID=UPI0037434DF8
MARPSLFQHPLRSLARSLIRNQHTGPNPPQPRFTQPKFQQQQPLPPNLGQTTPPYPSATQPSSPSASQPLTRLDRLISRLPRRFQPAASRLRSAPGKHITAFLILHEVTAVVPILAIFSGLHYFFGASGGGAKEGEKDLVSWVLDHCAGYVSEGIRRWEKYLVKRQMYGFDDGKIEGEEGVLRRWEQESKYRVVVELAVAYAVTKVLLPVRIAASLWMTPWLAGVLGRVGRVFRRRG